MEFFKEFLNLKIFSGTAGQILKKFHRNVPWVTQGPAWLSSKVFDSQSWVRTALDPLGFSMGVSLGKTLQSSSLVLVKPRKA